MGAAMLYFHPRDPRAIARTVLAIRADREGIRHRQKEAAAAIWQRTWKDVAAEWLPIFREAAGLGCGAATARKRAPLKSGVAA
jgi:hypothetical protein